MSGPLLRARGLKRRYRVGWLGLGRREALRGVDLEVNPGEVVGLAGESGSGKTTLVRCALGLTPCTGERALLGQDLTTLSPRGRRGLCRQVQLLFQEPEALLHPALRLREMLEESARLHQPGQDPAAAARALAERVGLDHRLEARPGELSGGEQRRAAAARALLADPVLLVADEPTAGLDAALKADLVELLLRGRDPARSTVLVSHDLPMLAWACERLVVLHAGRVIEELRVEALGRHPHHPYTTALLRASGQLQRPARHACAGPAEWSPGCALARSCPLASPRCAQEAPPLAQRAPGQRVACHHLDRV